MNILLDINDKRLLKEILYLKKKEHKKHKYENKFDDPFECDTCKSIIYLEKQIHIFEVEELNENRLVGNINSFNNLKNKLLKDKD